MNNKRPIRVIMAKPGLDGHDRGIKILARSFQEKGMEVIYLGLRQTPKMIIHAAIEEDADVIAISILSGAHMTYFTDIKKLMDQNITVIGIGKLGLCFALILEKAGYLVLGVDVSEEYVAKINSKYEPLCSVIGLQCFSILPSYHQGRPYKLDKPKPKMQI